MDDYTPWGKSLSIDLRHCNHDSITNPEPIKAFIEQLIRVVEMVAHGPCYIDCFGTGELKGYSAMQFIETSSITIHCDEQKDRVFIDIFSCKEFDVEKASTFSAEYFQGEIRQKNVLYR